MLKLSGCSRLTWGRGEEARSAPAGGPGTTGIEATEAHRLSPAPAHAGRSPHDSRTTAHRCEATETQCILADQGTVGMDGQLRSTARARAGASD